MTRGATSPRCRAGAPRGFTLLELLITLSVTTIGLIGLLALHLSIARGNDGASRSAEAQQLAVTELESLRSMSTAKLMTTLTGSDVMLLPTTPRVQNLSGRNGFPFKVTTTVTSPPSAPGLFKIRVVVSWTEEGGTAGASGGQLDHAIALEILRTLQEVL